MVCVSVQLRETIIKTNIFLFLRLKLYFLKLLNFKKKSFLLLFITAISFVQTELLT